MKKNFAAGSGNDTPAKTDLYSLSKAAGSQKKKDFTKKEKIFSSVSVVVLVITVFLSIFLIVWYANQNNYRDDHKQIYGYWYSDDKEYCFYFEDGLMREYVRVEGEERYEMVMSFPFKIFPKEQRITLSYNSHSSARLTYELTENTLILTEDDLTIPCTRGNKPLE